MVDPFVLPEPGFHSIAADLYHADPCPAPSLSGSIAIPLVTRSPRHAWYRHTRLNPDAEPFEPSPQMQFGSVCHRLLLGAGPDIEVIDADDWKTKAAREARDAAAALGRLPILGKDQLRATQMAAVASAKLNAALGPGWNDGRAELTMTWREGREWCRGMMDFVSADCSLVLDYKTTGANARPDEIERHFFDMHYHLKAAFYERGLDVLDPGNIGRRRFVFLFQETEPPFECSLIMPGEGGMMVGRKQATYAITRWQHCMAANEWPGYVNTIHRAAMPSWAEQRWLERELNDPHATGATSPDDLMPVYPIHGNKGF